MVRVAESVEIAAPPAQVFALVSDAAAKAGLNPFIQVIRVEREDPGPQREGSTTFLRLQKGTRIFEYRTRCRRLVPGRIIENQAELPTLLRVRVEVEPIPGGSRLTQHEECEVTLAMLDGLPVPRRAERAWRAIRILSLVLPALARETYAVIMQDRCEILRVVLRRELRAWLQAIQQHLESAATSSMPFRPDGEKGG
jgi:hypothetical protein